MYDQLLTSWESLNKIIPGLREDQVTELLNHEIVHKRRHDIVERLHARVCKLRMQRERVELMKLCQGE